MYQTVIEPRVSETDGIGHINNTTVPIWFEAGRNEIFKLFTPDDNFANWRMIILNMNVDYVQQIYFGTPVHIFIWVKKLGNSSLQLYEEMWQSGRLCAKDTVTYVNFNVQTQMSESISGSIREELEKHYKEQDER
ncbi:thioesterase family protein [Lentibacillus sp. N15]|uniref:acyl-CoA thioesterase n=1 Tax=Lentibacillus songyuanensis TaxID=3136161 RepID=UPI0031BB008F